MTTAPAVEDGAAAAAAVFAVEVAMNDMSGRPVFRLRGDRLRRQTVGEFRGLLAAKLSLPAERVAAPAMVLMDDAAPAGPLSDHSCLGELAGDGAVRVRVFFNDAPLGVVLTGVSGELRGRERAIEWRELDAATTISELRAHLLQRDPGLLFVDMFHEPNGGQLQEVPATALCDSTPLGVLRTAGDGRVIRIRLARPPAPERDSSTPTSVSRPAPGRPQPPSTRPGGDDRTLHAREPTSTPPRLVGLSTTPATPHVNTGASATPAASLNVVAVAPSPATANAAPVPPPPPPPPPARAPSIILQSGGASRDVSSNGVRDTAGPSSLSTSPEPRPVSPSPRRPTARPPPPPPPLPPPQSSGGTAAHEESTATSASSVSSPRAPPPIVTTTTAAAADPTATSEAKGSRPHAPAAPLPRPSSLLPPAAHQQHTTILARIDATHRAQVESVRALASHRQILAASLASHCATAGLPEPFPDAAPVVPRHGFTVDSFESEVQWMRASTSERARIIVAAKQRKQQQQVVAQALLRQQPPLSAAPTPARSPNGGGGGVGGTAEEGNDSNNASLDVLIEALSPVPQNTRPKSSLTPLSLVQQQRPGHLTPTDGASPRSLTRPHTPPAPVAAALAAFRSGGRDDRAVTVASEARRPFSSGGAAGAPRSSFVPSVMRAAPAAASQSRAAAAAAVSSTPDNIPGSPVRIIGGGSGASSSYGRQQEAAWKRQHQHQQRRKPWDQGAAVDTAAPIPVERIRLSAGDGGAVAVGRWGARGGERGGTSEGTHRPSSSAATAAIGLVVVDLPPRRTPT